MVILPSYMPIINHVLQIRTLSMGQIPLSIQRPLPHVPFFCITQEKISYFYAENVPRDLKRVANGNVTY